MSALDRALIRVYTQQPMPTAAAPHEGLRAVPLAEALADPPKPEDQRPPLTPDTVLDALAQPAPRLAEVPLATSEIALPPGSNELTEPQQPVPHFVKPKPGKRKTSKAAPTLEDLQMPELIYRVDATVGALPEVSDGAAVPPVPHIHLATSGLATTDSAAAGTVTADTTAGTAAPAPATPSKPRAKRPLTEIAVSTTNEPDKAAPSGSSSTGVIRGASGASAVSEPGTATIPSATPAAQSAAAARLGSAALPEATTITESVAAVPAAEPLVPAPHYALRPSPEPMEPTAGLSPEQTNVGCQSVASAAVSDQPSARLPLPETCARLLATASEQVDRLCDALASARLQGREVIALAAYRRSEGTSTVVLCAAQRLAERGLRIALVEADATGGQLAGALGLETRWGWDAALTKQVPLESVLVHMPGGLLTVLPWAGSEAAELKAAPDSAVVAEHLSSLAAGHHIVLLDCASLEEQGTTAGFLVRCLGKRLDGVVLVHNPNFTSRERIAEVQRRLTAAGVFSIGIVQNLARKR